MLCLLSYSEKLNCKLIETVFEAKQIDDVLQHHSLFLETCAKDCLLTDMPLVETVEDLLKLALTFGNTPTVSPYPIFCHKQRREKILTLFSIVMYSTVSVVYTKFYKFFCNTMCAISDESCESGGKV